MTDRPHPFVDRIAQACGDPGSIVGMKGENESVPRWSTRAVLRVLHETPLADQFAALNADDGDFFVAERDARRRLTNVDNG